jgi:hypothetical protein
MATQYPRRINKPKGKRRGVATKYNARTYKTQPGKGSPYVYEGIYYGMLPTARRVKFQVEAKKGRLKNRTIMQLLVNLMEKGYGWYAALTMARYFAQQELVSKIVNGRFNSKDIQGKLTPPKFLSPEQKRKYSNTTRKNCGNCGRRRVVGKRKAS